MDILPEKKDIIWTQGEMNVWLTKTCSTLLGTREIQIKIQVVTTRMTRIK